MFLFNLIGLSIALGQPNCTDIDNINEAIISIESMEFVKDTNGFLIDPRFYRLDTHYKDCLESFLKFSVKTMNEKETHKAFSTLRKTYFYTRSDMVLDRMSQFLNEIETTNPNRKNYTDIVNQFYRSSFKKVRATGVDLTTPTGIKVKRDKFLKKENIIVNQKSNSVFEIENLDLTNGKHLLIVASPYCHFSKEMFNWGEESGFFNRARFSKNINVTTVTESTNQTTVEAISKYNEASLLKYSLYINPLDWKPVNIWDTPTVFFIHDGVIVTQIVGWKKEITEAKIENAFEKFVSK